MGVIIPLSEKEKQYMRDLRKQGMSCKEISKRTLRTVRAVESFFYLEKIKKDRKRYPDPCYGSDIYNHYKHYPPEE